MVLDGDLRRYPQGHKPNDAIDVDAASFAPAAAPSAAAAAARAPPRRRARLAQIGGLDPWAQQAFVHAGDSDAPGGGSNAQANADGAESREGLSRRPSSPDDGTLPPLPPSLAAGASVNSAADASIAAQFPMPKLMQDPQAGHSVVDYASDRPVAPNYAALMRDARRVARERTAEYGAKSQRGRLRSQHQQLAEVYSHSHSSGGGLSQGDSGNEHAFYAMRGESLRDAAHEASLGRLRGRMQHALQQSLGKKTRTKDKTPPPPNFLFYPVRKGSSSSSSSSSSSVGAVGSVSAEPVIKVCVCARAHAAAAA